MPNRRHLTQELRRMLAIGQRQGFAVLVAFIDLDGFKAINDRHGHAAGDAFLQAVGARLQAAARSVDLPARSTTPGLASASWPFHLASRTPRRP